MGALSVAGRRAFSPLLSIDSHAENIGPRPPVRDDIPDVVGDTATLANVRFLTSSQRTNFALLGLLSKPGKRPMTFDYRRPPVVKQAGRAISGYHGTGSALAELHNSA